ncbi:hypothetical protein AOXY_G11709 [Acipenser oxyrinchus oxyrinchus]|uniref:Uncharacterized protein n=1 Tax=Acipenser oxyrinchus oxyrinchus TaxID=40147 RepID=A0AAD8G7G5_ACIOX|nr:hypothetical protein AOXY_G11709 [Acipenser oxyrinchus oxyrinchus]
MLYFSYYGMKSRLMMSAVHFNENASREQAVTQSGEAHYKIDFPIFQRGEHTVKKIMVRGTYKCVDRLKDCVFSMAQNGNKACPSKDMPPSMCHKYEKPSKEQAILNHESRFKSSH